MKKIRIRRIKRFTDLETRSRIRNFRKQKSPEYKLSQLWGRKRKNLCPKDLIFIVREIKYPELQKKAVEEFLEREDLNFDNFERMLNAAKDILEKNKGLKEQLLKECFQISTGNNLVELVEEGIPEAAKEILQKIETGSYARRNSIQLLIRLFEITRNAKAKMKLWKKIEKLDPDQEDLKYLLDRPGMYEFYKITSKIEKFLRRKNKYKQRRIKILRKIENLVEETKKGQV